MRLATFQPLCLDSFKLPCILCRVVLLIVILASATLVNAQNFRDVPMVKNDCRVNDGCLNLCNPRPFIRGSAVAFEDGSPADAFNEGIQSVLREESTAKGRPLAFAPSLSAPKASRIYGKYIVTPEGVTLELGLQTGVGDDVKKTPLPPIKTTKEKAVQDAIEAVRKILASEVKK